MGTESLNGPMGHFLSEVWFDEFQKWVVVDPQLDTIYFDDGIPLSFDELRAAGSTAGRLAVFGPGIAFQRRYAHIEAGFIEAKAGQKINWARHRGLWPRADFLTRPELTPPGHGTTAYCEANLVWEIRELEEDYGMFPYFGDQGYFNAPPVGWDEAR